MKLDTYGGPQVDPLIYFLGIGLLSLAVALYPYDAGQDPISIGYRFVNTPHTFSVPSPPVLPEWPVLKWFLTLHGMSCVAVAAFIRRSNFWPTLFGFFLSAFHCLSIAFIPQYLAGELQNEHLSWIPGWIFGYFFFLYLVLGFSCVVAIPSFLLSVRLAKQLFVRGRRV